jgi:hypothetical protein
MWKFKSKGIQWFFLSECKKKKTKKKMYKKNKPRAGCT